MVASDRRNCMNESCSLAWHQQDQATLVGILVKQIRMWLSWSEFEALL